MRILVANEDGCAGRALVQAAVRDGHRVLNLLLGPTAIRSVETEGRDLVADHATMRSEISDRAALDTILTSYRPDAVIHTAAPLPAGDLIGNGTLVEAIADYWRDTGRASGFRLLRVSCDQPALGVIGDGAGQSSVSEDASRAAVDHLIRTISEETGLPVQILCSAAHFGPCQSMDCTVPWMIRQALMGAPIRLGRASRLQSEWIYVDDLAKEVLAAMQSRNPEGAVRYRSGRSIRSISFVRMICAALDLLLPERAPHGRLISLRSESDVPLSERQLREIADGAAGDPNELARLRWDLEAVVKWYLDNPRWLGAMETRTGATAEADQQTGGTRARQLDTAGP